MKYLAGPVITLVVCLGCGGKTGGGSPGTGGGGGETRDAGRDSAGGSAADASSSGGARGGAGGGATGGTAGAGRGGAGGAKGGAGAAGGAGGTGGSGRCTVFQFPSTQQSTLSEALVDMDGDGRLDVVSTWTDSNGFHVLIHRQTSPRVFADPVEYVDTQIGPYFQTGIAAADLDQDGIPDLAMPDLYGYVTLMLSGGGTGFSFPPWITPPKIQTVFDVALGDFDGDGNRDIVIPVDDTGISHAIYWGTGKGAFGARDDRKVCGSGTDVAVIDANEDGRPDLVVTCYGGGAQVLINQGGRSFMSVLLPGASESAAVATGDLNNDGHVDVVIPDQVLDQVVVSLGDGHGGFTVPSGYIASATSNIGAAAVGDLDGDGNADVLLADFNLTTLAFYKGTGDGHLQPSQTFPTVTRTTRHFVIGDVDGDGVQDLLTGGGGATIVYGPCP